MTATPLSSLDKYVLLQFKSGLWEQQRWLLESIKEAERTIRELRSSDPRDIADEASGRTLEVSVLAQHSESRNRLRLVELALERICGGTFGTCAECVEAIGLKRLQAVPWTSHCIQCQERHEQHRVPEYLATPETVPAG